MPHDRTAMFVQGLRPVTHVAMMCVVTPISTSLATLAPRAFTASTRGPMKAVSQKTSWHPAKICGCLGLVLAAAAALAALLAGCFPATFRAARLALDPCATWPAFGPGVDFMSSAQAGNMAHWMGAVGEVWADAVQGIVSFLTCIAYVVGEVEITRPSGPPLLYTPRASTPTEQHRSRGSKDKLPAGASTYSDYCEVVLSTRLMVMVSLWPWTMSRNRRTTQHTTSLGVPLAR